MVYMMLRFKVADYERWKATFDGSALWRMNIGEQNYHVYRDVDDPNEVTLLEGWEDFTTAQLFATSDDLRRKNDEGGVIGPPQILFLNEVEGKML